ncbi:MAG: TetR/AcrR family transcriptional regulator [Chloroflexi bacterium AL-W]|nr:TetR/AcrR family transcriptional regulator [Chloroflexi bacterium AL-N1]NOK64646.1 TetR/AcrR family transcriptional regulator [Chloroflexi bacterium AL-N10]NOK75887.1 TetR/AcrR family transcriptional regulator [Chloroflexi bacterium AL-N5]NOK80355.1 TetR/AcrR family transcriptional regulator [Chloroflexi bacterium AL-W]NOK86868.1 TetR/AcrR family transcriptional regulator [Chloroflexi bacterium AL-N15]
MATDARTTRKQLKRDQIRAGARRLFLEQGFAGASTDAIAAAASVSKQTLYAYYPTKEDLLTDVLQQLVDGLPHGSFVTALSDHPIDAPETLRMLLVDLAQRISNSIMQPDYIALMRVLIAEAPRLPQLSHLFTSTAPERAFRSIAILLREAHRSGVVNIPDVDAATRLFIGPLLTYAILDGLFVPDGPPRPPAPERITAVIDLFMQSITVST